MDPLSAVYAWGAGTSGQLGLGPLCDELAPRPVPGLRADIDIVGPDLRDDNCGSRGAARVDTALSVACGGSHVVAVRGRGEAWGWGAAIALGELLGAPPTEAPTAPPHPTLAIPEPVRLGGLLASVRVRSVAAGWAHSAFVADGGALYMVGEGAFGQLGTGDTANRSSAERVAVLDGYHVMAAACGLRHTLALALPPDGAEGSNCVPQVWAWGSDKHGQLGRGELSRAAAAGASGRRGRPPALLPVLASPLPGGLEAASLAAGGDHSAALDAEGHLFLWGRGLGPGVAGMPAPAALPAPSLRGRGWRQVALGWGHALALSDEGDVYAWGSDRYGQLGPPGWGDDARGDAAAPRPVGGLAGPGARARAVAVAAGAEHSAVLLAPGSEGGGRLLTWGWGEHGQTGTGTTEDLPVPTVVPGLSLPLAGVSCGCGFTLALAQGHHS